MDVGNTSGSSSSTIVVPEKIGPESESLPVKRQDESVIANTNLGVKDNEEACCARQASPSSLACILYLILLSGGFLQSEKTKTKTKSYKILIMICRRVSFLRHLLQEKSQCRVVEKAEGRREVVLQIITGGGLDGSDLVVSYPHRNVLLPIPCKMFFLFLNVNGICGILILGTYYSWKKML